MVDLKPINYRISLEPDLENFRFSGHTEISMETLTPVNEITLNVFELAISTCKIGTEAGFFDCPFYVNPKKEELIVYLPNEVAGKVNLKIDYVGNINDRMAGFYRSKYVNKGKTKYIAITQFQESDARRAFPCFDQPVMKATFDMEVVVDDDLTAISNMPIAGERHLPNGKKTVTFQQTPRMSTYLLFFGIGEFEFLEDQKDVRVRVATMPGMEKYAQFGLEFGRKCLEFCEEYCGIKYPLPKLDLISIPDFAFGAMENWGAITFRENLLLHYPGRTSKAGEERICEVIAHEIAHQWFGNLVTPVDWKYLWLNESFATYLGYGVVSFYHPEWDTWEQFLHSQTDTALDRDALHETFPMEIPAGEHVVINTSTAPIIYSKGGSILRQAEGYIGNNNFKQGLRHCLNAHEYACASSQDLWESLESASEKPVTKIMKNWIEQHGFPVVEVKKTGDSLVLTQKRFTYLPNESRQVWLIPITVRIFYNKGRSKLVTTLLDNKTTTVRMGKNAVTYKLNDGQTGFYRVIYVDDDVLDELGKLVQSKVLSPNDRWGLQNDLYAFVKSGDVSLEKYLKFLSNYVDEDTFLPLTSIAHNLFHAYMVVEGHWKEKIASIARSLLENILMKIGFDPNPEEKHTISILRDQIIWHAVLYGSKEAQDFALTKLRKFMRGEAIHPDIVKSVMQVGALNSGAEVFEWLLDRINSSDSEHERINILTALGSFNNRALIEEAQRYTLEKAPNRNKFIPIVSMAANPYAAPLMWDWFRTKSTVLEQFHPLHYERVIAGVIPVCGLGKEEEVNSFFKKYMAQKGIAKDAIRMSLERLQVNSRIRELSRLSS
jgi:tricorn protease interacting factor F2/3